MRALALGADATLVGRPYLWGLAAGGEEGVADVLEALREDVARTLALVGARTPARSPPTTSGCADGTETNTPLGAGSGAAELSEMCSYAAS